MADVKGVLRCGRGPDGGIPTRYLTGSARADTEPSARAQALVRRLVPHVALCAICTTGLTGDE